MRKILIILFGILTIYACSKDSLSIEEKEEGVFCELIGRWQLQRYSHTPDFKVEPNGGFTDEEKESYIEFALDSVYTCCYYIGYPELNCYTDKFKIKFNEDNKPYIECEEGLSMPGLGFRGNIDIYSISKDILIFYHKFQYNSYFEYKRIK